MKLRTAFFAFVFSIFFILASCQKPEDKIDQLRQELKTNTTQSEKIKIIDKIAKIEHNRASSVLLNTLGDINYRDVHSRVILALGEVRPIHKQTVSRLLEKLSDIAFRDDIIKSIVLIGPEATSAVIKQLASEDEDTRNSAFYVLSQMGEPAAQEILNSLEDSNPNVRSLAITLIGDITTNSNSAEAYIIKLIEVFGHEVTDINQANIEFQLLAETFNKIGKPTIPHLTSALKNAKFQVRIGAALALYPIDNTKKDITLPILIEALGDDAYGSVVAIKLASFGKSILPDLEKAFNGDDPTTYRNAATTLGNMGALSLPILQSFIESIALNIDEFDQTTLNKAEATLTVLEQFGTEAKPLIEKLVEMLRHEQLSENAASVLASIGDSTVPILIQSLQDKNLKTRKNAALALGMMGPIAIDATEPLAEMLRNSDIYGDAAYALTAIQFSSGSVQTGQGGMGPNNAIGYALAHIESSTTRVDRLRLGSDDGITVWLNNEIVWNNNTTRGGLRPNMESVNVNLKKGKNKLLIKIWNNFGPWGFFADLSGKAPRSWQIIHPFAGPLDTVHPPETQIDLEKRYKGLENQDIGWYKTNRIGFSAFSGMAILKPKSSTAKEVPLKVIIAALKKGFIQEDFAVKSRCIEAINILGSMSVPLLLDLATETRDTMNEGTVAQLLSTHADVETLLKMVTDRKFSWLMRRAGYEGLRVYKSQAESAEYQGSSIELTKVEDGIAYFEGVESARKLVKSLEGKMTNMQLQKITDESIRVGIEAVPFLIEAFNSKVSQARGRASSILVEIGQDAVPALKTASRIGNDKEIYWAELTLKKIEK